MIYLVVKYFVRFCVCCVFFVHIVLRCTAPCMPYPHLFLFICWCLSNGWPARWAFASSGSPPLALFLLRIIRVFVMVK